MSGWVGAQGSRRSRAAQLPQLNGVLHEASPSHARCRNSQWTGSGQWPACRGTQPGPGQRAEGGFVARMQDIRSAQGHAGSGMCLQKRISPPTPRTWSYCPVLMCSAMMVLKVEAAGGLLKAGAQLSKRLSHTGAIPTMHLALASPPCRPAAGHPAHTAWLTCGACRAAWAQHFMEDS